VKWKMLRYGCRAVPNLWIFVISQAVCGKQDLLICHVLKCSPNEGETKPVARLWQAFSCNHVAINYYLMLVSYLHSC
jgi:hypothetical protein